MERTQCRWQSRQVPAPARRRLVERRSECDSEINFVVPPSGGEKYCSSAFRRSALPPSHGPTIRQMRLHSSVHWVLTTSMSATPHRHPLATRREFLWRAGGGL